MDHLQGGVDRLRSNLTGFRPGLEHPSLPSQPPPQPQLRTQGFDHGAGLGVGAGGIGRGLHPSLDPGRQYPYPSEATVYMHVTSPTHRPQYP